MWNVWYLCCLPPGCATESAESSLRRARTYERAVLLFTSYLLILVYRNPVENVLAIYFPESQGRGG